MDLLFENQSNCFYYLSSWILNWSLPVKRHLHLSLQCQWTIPPEWKSHSWKFKLFSLVLNLSRYTWKKYLRASAKKGIIKMKERRGHEKRANDWQDEDEGGSGTQWPYGDRRRRLSEKNPVLKYELVVHPKKGMDPPQLSPAPLAARLTRETSQWLQL